MFAKYVSGETVIAAGFNYFEPSYLFIEGDKLCRAHHTYFDNTNLVVIESHRVSGSPRTELFLCTFEGPDFVEQPEENVQKSLRFALRRKHRIAGRDLEAAIQREVDLHE